MRYDIRKPNDQFITAIRGLYFSMQFLGIWPQPRSKNWYQLIWYIQSIGFAFLVFGPMAELIVQIHDIRKIIDNLGAVIPVTSIFIKWLTFSSNKKTIEMILRSLEEDWINLDRNTSMNRHFTNSKQIMMIHYKFAKYSFNTYIAMTTFAITNSIRDACASRNSYSNGTNLEGILPIRNSWYPLDYNQSFNIQFLTVTQAITCTTFSLANASMDRIFVTVTLHLCAQFKILRHFIESIIYDPSRPEYCAAKVRLMAQRHQALLELGETLQESYSFIILEQLVASTLTICFLGYKIIAELESDSVNLTVLLESGVLCLAAVQTILVYCLAGDHLTNESLAVAMAVYNAEWYNFTRSINLLFLIVMIRARKPVTMRGAKSLPMSLESFTIILKSAASYLLVLRTMISSTSEV